MFSTIAKTSALAILASMAVGATAEYEGRYFIQDTGAPLVVERIDPVMNPGGVASHVHSVVGSNAFAATMNYAMTQAASCSTAFVKADKSSYWMPSLYFQDPKNGSFIRVPERPEHKIYYYNRSGNNETIQEFPKEFRMIAGDPRLRAPAATKQLQGVTEWYCHGPPKDYVDSGFPKGFTGCGYGIAGSIHFPHCWNGNDFDIANPYAHVSYPMGDHPDSGYCPPSHPHVLPHIFIEFWFNTKSFDGLYGANDNPWVLSQGDPTGYGFHGDFVNGWQEGVLLDAMHNCNIGESGRPLSDCFEVWTDAERNACTQQTIVHEVIDGWLDALPGCNPVQAGPGRATAQKCGSQPSVTNGSGSSSVAAAATTGSGSAVPARTVSTISTVSTVPTVPIVSSVVGGVDTPASAPLSYSAASSIGSASAAATSVAATSATEASPAEASAADSPAAESSASRSSAPAPAPSAAPSSNSTSSAGLPSGWTFAGCYTDALNPRSLRGITFAWFGEAMTSTGCASHCASKGFAIAGTENGGQCFCGNELIDSRPASAGVCNIRCKGDAGQTCGGKAALSVYTDGGRVDLPGGAGGASGSAGGYGRGYGGRKAWAASRAAR